MNENIDLSECTPEVQATFKRLITEVHFLRKKNTELQLELAKGRDVLILNEDQVKSLDKIPVDETFDSKFINEIVDYCFTTKELQAIETTDFMNKLKSTRRYRDIFGMLV